VDERIDNEKPDEGHNKPYFYFDYHGGPNCMPACRPSLGSTPKGNGWLKSSAWESTNY
jgi:hypothetical protein